MLVFFQKHPWVNVFVMHSTEQSARALRYADRQHEFYSGLCFRGSRPWYSSAFSHASVVRAYLTVSPDQMQNRMPTQQQAAQKGLLGSLASIPPRELAHAACRNIGPRVMRAAPAQALLWAASDQLSGFLDGQRAC